MLLLVWNEKILVAVGWDDYRNVGYCFLASCYVNFLGVECFIPFLLDCSLFLLGSNVDTDSTKGIKLVVLLLCLMIEMLTWRFLS